MDDPALLQQQLTEAEAAYHTLITGRKPVSIKVNGEKEITYTAADAATLQGYISTLKSKLGIGCRRSIGVTF